MASFKLDCKKTLQKLPALVSITPNGNHYLAKVNGRVFAIGVSTDAFVAIDLMVECDEPFLFGIDVTTFSGILKNRTEITITTLDSATISFSSGRYSGKMSVLTAVDVKEIARRMKNEESGFALPRQLLTAIKEGLKSTNLTNIYTNEEMPALITCKGSKLIIDTFDEWHVARYMAPVESEEFSIGLLRAHFNIVDKYADGDTKFIITDAYLRVTNEHFIFEFPTMAIEPQQFEMVDILLSSLKQPDATLLLHSEKLRSVVTNMFAFNANDATITFLPTQKGVDLKVTSQHGEASDHIKCKTSVDAKCVCDFEPRLLVASTNIIDSAATISCRLYKKHCAVLRTRNQEKDTHQTIIIVCKT